MSTTTVFPKPFDKQVDDLRNVGYTISFTIPSSGWTSTSPYTYTWEDDRVIDSSWVEVSFINNTGDDTNPYFSFEKLSNGSHGLLFTATKKPTKNTPVQIHITNVHPDSVVDITGDMVQTTVISGTANVDEALTSVNSTLSTVNTNLGSPSSASAVTGADAFAKIATVNGKLTTISAATSSKTLAAAVAEKFGTGSKNGVFIFTCYGSSETYSDMPSGITGYGTGHVIVGGNYRDVYYIDNGGDVYTAQYPKADASISSSAWKRLVLKSELTTIKTDPTAITGVTISSGGYMQIGRLVVVNVRLVLSSSKAANEDLMYIPTCLFNDSPLIANDGLTQYKCRTYSARIVSSEAFPAGTYQISGTYFSAS